MSSNLKDGADSNLMKSDLTRMAQHYVSSYMPSKSSLKKHAILKKLKTRSELVITKPDKGNGVVIMNRTDYHLRMLEMIGDGTKFQKRDRFIGNARTDITIFRERQLQNYLLGLKNAKLIDDNVYERIYPRGSLPARIYGQPKMHKLDNNLSQQVPPFRIIVSSIGSYNYDIAKYLTEILSPHIPTEHSASDTFTFIEDLKNVSLQNKFLVSYDVVSLFTNVPLSETIDLAVNLIKSNDPSVKMSHAQLRKLFLFATSQTHFVYNDQYYDQVDGVAMGSPLGPVLANLFMGIHEAEWLDSYTGVGPSFYKRYVDDIFCVFDSEDQAKSFLEFLNSRHENIKFTSEYELDGILAFLDVHISRDTNGLLVTTTYRKPTNTGLLTNFDSFTSFSYKIGLIKTLTDRAYKINSDAAKLKEDLKYIVGVLQRNMFPMILIKKVMKSCLDKLESGNPPPDPPINSDGEVIVPRYFKLPYVGPYSSSVKLRLRQLLDTYCKDIDVCLIFTSFKIGQYFSNKDRIPAELKSRVVYKFVCGGCEASYIGQTIRHLSTRTHEHLCTDHDSAIYKHLHVDSRQGRVCKRSSNENSFSILDHAKTKYQLRLKEGLYIKKQQPILNKSSKKVPYAPHIYL